MRIALNPQEAFSYLLKLSLQFNEVRTAEAAVKPAPYLMRSFESLSTAFVAKDESSWISRFLERITYYISSYFDGRQVLPYDLEANFEYLNLLFDKAVLHEGNFLEVDLGKNYSRQFHDHFHSKPMKAIESLVHNLMPLCEKTSLTQNRREKLAATNAKIQALVQHLHSKEEVFVIKKKVVQADSGAKGGVEKPEKELYNLQKIREEIRGNKTIKDIGIFALAVKTLKDKLTGDHSEGLLQDHFTGLCELTLLEFKRFIKHELGLHARIKDGISESEPRNFQERIIDVCAHFSEKQAQIDKRIAELQIEGQKLPQQVVLTQLDAVSTKLKAELLKCTKQHLDALFSKMSQNIKEKIKRTETLHGFYHAHEEIRHEVHDLIEHGQKITDTTLQDLFNVNMRKILSELQISQLPRYRQLLDKEVLPQLQNLLADAATKKDAEVSQLQEGVDNLILCLRNVKEQLSEACTDSGACELELKWLEKTIEQIEHMKNDLQRRLKSGNSELDEKTAQQTVSGQGVKVVIANSSNTHVTIHGSDQHEAESLLSQITQGIAPAGLLQSILSYGPTVVLTATSMYLTGGLSLSWSLISGVALAAAPPVVKSATRYVLPKPLVPIVEPLIDFAARLLILRYGAKCVEFLTQPAAVVAAETVAAEVLAAETVVAETLVVQEAVKVAAGSGSAVLLPVAAAAKDAASAIPAQVPPGLEEAMELDALVGGDVLWSISGVALKSFAMLATLFMMSSKQHSTKNLVMMPAEA
jgi:hypothetical protein